VKPRCSALSADGSPDPPVGSPARRAALAFIVQEREWVVVATNQACQATGLRKDLEPLQLLELEVRK